MNSNSLDLSKASKSTNMNYNHEHFENVLEQDIYDFSHVRSSSLQLESNYNTDDEEEDGLFIFQVLI